MFYSGFNFTSAYVVCITEMISHVFIKLHLAHPGSQSQCTIQFILPACLVTAMQHTIQNLSLS